MGLFKKKSTDPAELELIKADIMAMAARLDRTDSDKDALGPDRQAAVVRGLGRRQVLSLPSCRPRGT